MSKVPTANQWQDLANRIKGKVNKSLVDNILLSKIDVVLPTGAALDNYTTPGIYISDSATKSASLTNTPITSAGFKLIVEYTISDARLRQTIYANNSTSDTFYRSYTAAGWQGWRKVTTTAV